MLHANLYGNYRNRKFTDLYSNVEAFVDDYKNDNPEFINGIPTTISDTSISTLFYLLYAKYGNSTIASSDETQFKYKLFSYIFMYGPTWESRLKIQDDLRGLIGTPEMQESARAIYNHSMNPSTTPSDQDTEELPTVNDQNVTKHRRSKIDAYAMLYELIRTDVTNEFLNKFKNLFLTVVTPELPLWYETELNIEGE